ncbi:MAG: aminotransferase class I/II-fold pyridoxal phosphate-dependent enzyme [Chloroflexota bacterium]
MLTDAFSRLRALPPFKLERYFARYEFSAEYLLCSSDCESLAIGDLLAFEPGAAEAFQRHWLGYTESLGAPGLRRGIAGIYQAIEPEQVLVHSGAEEAILLFYLAALQPGDHVIVHWPGYQSLAEIPAALGCQVTPWRARPENGWALDLDELERLARPETRLVVVNTPHNPTGYLMAHADLERLAGFCRQRGLLLLVDEVYRESEYSDEDRLPAACDVYEQAVSLGVMSKTYGLAGLRIGWIATRSAEVYRRMAALKDYTTICSSAPSEFLAELALRHRARLTARTRSLLLDNLALLDQFFAGQAGRLRWVRPRAGSVAFPEYLDGDVERFCHALVSQAGVLLAPGELFDYPGNHFRIGLGRRSLPQALARLQDFLERPTAG